MPGLWELTIDIDNGADITDEALFRLCDRDQSKRIIFEIRSSNSMFARLRPQASLAERRQRLRESRSFFHRLIRTKHLFSTVGHFRVWPNTRRHHIGTRQVLTTPQ